ncbi:flocculation protein FLO11-like [Malania oleifera]|uniref:flocculation protein FLO11-like n=1 Tax=Malania oleifera TaxID=397392 RepID=UPI0025AE2AF2|nr:flocculation protein FLO11-like [Malania oleifera]
MMGDKAKFTSIKPNDGGFVTFGDNVKGKIIGVIKIGHPSSSQQPSPPPPPPSRPHSSNSSHEPRRKNLPVLSLPAPYSIHPCFGSLRTAATTAETSLCNSPQATSQKPQPRPPFQPSATNPTTPSSSRRQQQRPPATPEAFLCNSATTLPPTTTESAATSRKPPRPPLGPSSSATSSTTTTILQAQTQDTRQTAAISTHRRPASPVPALCTHRCTLQHQSRPRLYPAISQANLAPSSHDSHL